MNNVEVLRGLLGVLDSYEFVLGRPTGLANAIVRVSPLSSLSHPISMMGDIFVTGITSKAGVDSLIAAEYVANQNRIDT